MELGGEGKARVIPVNARDVNWSAAPFAKLQALPKEGTVDYRHLHRI
jgi:hypothetical protein